MHKSVCNETSTSLLLAICSKQISNFFFSQVIRERFKQNIFSFLRSTPRNSQGQFWSITLQITEPKRKGTAERSVARSSAKSKMTTLYLALGILEKVNSHSLRYVCLLSALISSFLFWINSFTSPSDKGFSFFGTSRKYKIMFSFTFKAATKE